MSWDIGRTVRKGKYMTKEMFDKRFRRLDTLRVLTEGYEEGEGYNICQKARRAEWKQDFTGIIRLTRTEKDFLGYMLESDMLDDYEVEIINWYMNGGRK